MNIQQTYNTGKVKIGIAYNSYRPPYHDSDAVLMQSALLGKHPKRGTDDVSVAIALAAVVAVVTTFVVVTL